MMTHSPFQGDSLGTYPTSHDGLEWSAAFLHSHQPSRSHDHLPTLLPQSLNPSPCFCPCLPAIYSQQSSQLDPFTMRCHSVVPKPPQVVPLLKRKILNPNHSPCSLHWLVFAAPFSFPFLSWLPPSLQLPCYFVGKSSRPLPLPCLQWAHSPTSFRFSAQVISSEDYVEYSL